jgi:murein DD-endopeptidase MepM/ murein hydrolase activator NlpD
MTLWKRKDELARALAAAALAALSLSACTTSPRTQLSWGVNEHASRSARVVYGPQSVKLPPAEKHRFVPPEQADRRYAAAQTSKPRKTPGWYTQDTLSPVQTGTRDSTDLAADATIRFRWPVSGRVISDYGSTRTGERNDGINIAAAQGAPIHAAASGTVSYCGNELKGYGNLVLIKHEGGYITAYAHVDNFIVNRDDRVLAGQVIAYAGATGDVATPQLHFEIRQGVRPIDPKALLPKTLIVASN